MKTVNLTPKITITPREIKVFEDIFHRYEEYSHLCEDTSDFILENIYISDDRVTSEAFSIVANLRSLMKLFKQLTPIENEN